MITSCIAAICITGAVAIDGDTLRLNSPGKSFRLRLWGIDAPELKAPLGIDAREALARLVDNKAVSCDLMDVDRYGRPVVRCGTATTPDIACELVRYGTARDFPRYSAGYYASCAPAQK